MALQRSSLGSSSKDELAKVENKLPRILMSPPVSPSVDNIDATREDCHGPSPLRQRHSDPDPVLYPDDPSEEVKPARTLFPYTPERRNAEQAVDKHIMAASVSTPRSRPTREEYMMALSFHSSISGRYSHNPGAYLKRARDEMDDDWTRAKRIRGTPGVTSVVKRPRLPMLLPSNKMRSPKPIALLTPKVKIIRIPRTPKMSGPRASTTQNATGRMQTPEAIRPLGNKRPEDIEYQSLEDFCPPLSTLDSGKVKGLKIDWNSSNPLNLSSDPDRHLLHEAEVVAASTLRLSCATYLCSKRRIFAARLQALKIGKEFRKTDAQQACKIDVNKASKLWIAYDKVGWFEARYFEKFLEHGMLKH
ncbi:hypothetical protein MMC25_008147 [Agyrium rufum]|nr:hypothetical protein [Agyrium rufum]